MAKKTYSYEGEGITVLYDAARCIHAAECVHRAPSVFDPERRPWVDPTAASAETSAAVVEACPTGALTYRRADGAQEAPPASALVSVAADGPLYLVGDVEIRSSEDEVIHRGTRVALCRCGASSLKPFCDGSHTDAGFKDEGRVEVESVEAAGAPASPRLVVKIAPNGPLIISGDFELAAADGARPARRDRAALCRCGASRDKPLCDGSHVAIGFEDEAPGNEPGETRRSPEATETTR